MGMRLDYKRWTPAEDALMHELYESSTPMVELVARFGRKADALWRRAVHLGLVRPRGPRAGGPRMTLPEGYAHWTAENDAYLLAVYSTHTPMLEIIEHVGHPINSVYKRAKSLGLKRIRPVSPVKPKAAPVVFGALKPGKPARKTRAGWGPNDPIHFPKDEHGNPLYRHIVAPPPPTMVFRTSTFR